MDADIVAKIDSTYVKALKVRLSDAFYADEGSMIRAIQDHSSFNLIHFDSMFKVDIFIPGPRSIGAIQLARKQPKVIRQEPEEIAYLSSPEDIILAKLDWYRAGGGISDRQWLDVTGVIRTQAQQLDLDYLRNTAAQFQLADLLNRALRETQE